MKTKIKNNKSYKFILNDSVFSGAEVIAMFGNKNWKLVNGVYCIGNESLFVEL